MTALDILWLAISAVLFLAVALIIVGIVFIIVANYKAGKALEEIKQRDPELKKILNQFDKKEE